MGLSTDDLQAIRGIMREEIQAEVPPLVRGIIQEEVPPMVRGVIQEEVPPLIHKEMSLQLGPVSARLRDIDDRLIGMEGRLEVVENDVKNIYFIISDMQESMGSVRRDVTNLRGLVKA